MRSSETYEQSYAGNASTVTAYPINFQFLDGEDLEIMVTDTAGAQSVLATSAYTITRDSVTELGSFVTAAAIPATSTVKIYRANQLLQEHDYVNSDTFPADSHEQAVDRLTEGLQSVRSMAARALRVSPADAEIDPAAAESDTIAGFDSSGAFILRDAAEAYTFLSLTAPILNMPTKTWANNAQRALAVPDFLGQVGVQLDTGALYVSTGVSAGNWTASVAGTVADLSITRAKLADGALTADVLGRAKMADLFITLAKMNVDFITGMTAKTLLEDGDYLAGWSATDAAFRKFAGAVVDPPGSVVQSVYSEYVTNTNITAVIPGDDTVPQITEGTQILTLSITPRYADSVIKLSFFGTMASAGSGAGPGHCAALFRNPVTNSIASQLTWPAGTDYPMTMGIVYQDSPATTSATTYTVRVGPANAGTVRMNGYASARAHGGAMKAILSAEEIKV